MNKFIVILTFAGVIALIGIDSPIRAGDFEECLLRDGASWSACSDEIYSYAAIPIDEQLRTTLREYGAKGGSYGHPSAAQWILLNDLGM